MSSSVPSVPTLAWLLECVIPLGEPGGRVREGDPEDDSPLAIVLSSRLDKDIFRIAWPNIPGILSLGEVLVRR